MSKIYADVDLNKTITLVKEGGNETQATRHTPHGPRSGLYEPRTPTARHPLPRLCDLHLRELLQLLKRPRMRRPTRAYPFGSAHFGQKRRGRFVIGDRVIL